MPFANVEGNSLMKKSLEHVLHRAVKEITSMMCLSLTRKQWLPLISYALYSNLLPIVVSIPTLHLMSIIIHDHFVNRVNN